jgi:hypothetical protein
MQRRTFLFGVLGSTAVLLPKPLIPTLIQQKPSFDIHSIFVDTEMFKAFGDAMAKALRVRMNYEGFTRKLARHYAFMQTYHHCPEFTDNELRYFRRVERRRQRRIWNYRFPVVCQRQLAHWMRANKIEGVSDGRRLSCQSV